MFQLWCPEVVIVVRLSWTSTFLGRCGLLFSHWEWLGMCELFPNTSGHSKGSWITSGNFFDTFAAPLRGRWRQQQRWTRRLAIIELADARMSPQLLRSDKLWEGSRTKGMPVEHTPEIKASSRLCSLPFGPTSAFLSDDADDARREFMDTFEAQNRGIINRFRPGWIESFSSLTFY